MNCAVTTRLLAVAAVLAWMSHAEAKPLVYRPNTQTPSAWEHDYGAATERAKREKKMLLIAFNDQNNDVSRRIEQHLESDQALRSVADDQYVLASLATSTEIKIEGSAVRLLAHPAFAEMINRPGLAMVDYRRPNSRWFGYVVTVYPLSSHRQLGEEHFKVLLNLPAGSLTQRSLIYAVRTHPERPASADGEHSDVLASESEQHSVHQASISVQGHHNWESRFHRINAQLPGDYLAQEVCAESWPGQSLLDAAEDCVASWRQSSGHWSAVRSRHRFFGYDMKIGRNRVWYATGIFARRR